METEVQKFYRNKSVFLTGGTGFLGKVYIEKILRVTDVERIYVLIRPKRDKSVYERIDDIFKDPLFEKLHKIKPNPAKYVTPIFGDCVLPNLGLSEDDRNTLIENVDVLVNSAATVRFTEPISNALAINVRATMDLMELAKNMLKLQAFVHVSSAFANCNVPHIEERYYTDRIGISADKICKLAEIVGPDVLNRMSNELCRGYPNTYCYTKALAEEAVLAQGAELPICVFRPGIVISTFNDPVSGWIDNLYGPTSILYGVSYGVLRVLYAKIESSATIVPVDFCVNAMLVCAWKMSKSAEKITLAPPPIYNLVPDENNKLRWSEYQNSMQEHGSKLPLTRTIWFPFLISTESKFFYKLLCFIYHTIPGYIFDFVLLLLGKKRRMVKTYRKIHKQTAALHYFVERSWTFTMDNTKELWQSLSAEDQRLFQFDMLAINWSQYFYNSLCGMRRYLAKEDPTTIPTGLKLYKRLFWLHRAVQLLVYGGGATLLFRTSWSVFQWIQ